MRKWISFEKKKVRISRPARKILLGTGIAFFSAVFVIGLLTLFYFGIRIALVWFHIMNTEISSYQEEKTISIPTGLTFNSFSDLFSGEGRVSLSQSSGVYWGRNETAFISPPVYEWRKVGEIETFFDTTSCIGGVCIEKKEEDIFLNNEIVILPFSSERISVSYGMTSNMFIVGQVVFHDGVYEGYVYTLTPQGDLEELFSFSSQYKGALGIGGYTNEWMVVYGAYEGRAWHVTGDSITDISSLVSFRIMNGGFAPHIIRGDEGWYIIGEEDLNPKFIKLFGSPVPYGVIDFSPLLFTENIRSISLSLFDGNTTFVFYSPYTEETWEFVDKGFFLEKAEIVSENINVSFNPIAYVVLKDLVLKGSIPLDILISSDKEEWESIHRGENLLFRDTSLFWKIVLDPEKPFFFDKVQFDYWTE